MQFNNSLTAEKDTVNKMIRLYCRKKHGSQHELCPDCRDLLAYASQRLDRCKFGHAKPTCEKCTIHCYRPEMRNKIKTVMRFSGPRMILAHPWLAIKHMLKNMRS